MVCGHLFRLSLALRITVAELSTTVSAEELEAWQHYLGTWR